MVAFETLHYMRNQRTKKNGYVAVKLDMSKVYDRVEYGYMEKLMEKMGFNDKWVGLMMTCIMSASYSILVNGKPKGDIVTTRGLKQEDPLSPYLFSLCTEGLHGLMKQAATIGALRGVALCKNGPKLTHILFANDSLVFCKVDGHDCQNLLAILTAYERALGQQVNRAKSSLFFNKYRSLSYLTI